MPNLISYFQDQRPQLQKEELIASILTNLMKTMWIQTLKAAEEAMTMRKKMDKILDIRELSAPQVNPAQPCIILN